MFIIYKTMDACLIDTFIYLNKNSISHELCDDLIKLFEEETDGKYEGITHGGLNKDIKDTTDFIIAKKNEKWSKMYDFLEKELKTNMKKYYTQLNKYDELCGYSNHGQKSSKKYKILNYEKFDISTFMMQRYKKNTGRYIYHNDFSIDYKNSKHRVVTYLWYLNTVEEGGETEFWGNYKIKPEKGKLLLFPACWTFPHCGKMPISDNKYIITGWVYVHS